MYENQMRVQAFSIFVTVIFDNRTTPNLFPVVNSCCKTQRGGNSRAERSNNNSVKAQRKKGSNKSGLEGFSIYFFIFLFFILSFVPDVKLLLLNNVHPLVLLGFHFWIFRLTSFVDSACDMAIEEIWILASLVVLVVTDSPKV